MPVEAEAFYQTIRENPDDDAPRLIFADWLEEHGDTARAEFVRLQCQLAQLPEDNPGHPDYPAWKAREYALLTAHGEEWAAPIRSLVRGWEFRRGFIDIVTMEAAVFLQKAEALLRAAPVRHIRFLEAGCLLDRLAENPHLGRLSALQFSANYLHDAGVQALAQSPYLGRLKFLHLGRNNITFRGVRALAATPGLAGLQGLILSHNFITSEAVPALVESPHLVGLQALDLSYNFIGLAGQQRLRERFGEQVRLFHQGHASQVQQLEEWLERQYRARGQEEGGQDVFQRFADWLDRQQE